MLTQKEFLENEGKEAVEVIKDAIAKIKATGDTEKSIRLEVDDNSFTIFGRIFFSSMETGRGPRKSNKEGGFKDRMLEYMKAKGIGSDLTPKKREQLARFLVLKINREGDRTYKNKGRELYSKKLDEFVEGFKERLKDEFKGKIVNTLKNAARE